MNLGILVTGESEETHFAIFLGFFQGFGCAVFTDEEFGVVIESHSVNLPEVEMIGLQTAQ